MADSTIQLPYTGTTSGDLLDASLLGAVKRERMVIGNDASTAVAVVTSSGDLRVQFPTGATVTISGGVLVILSSPTSLSSGTVTLSSNPTVISASSGLVQISGPVTVVSASSGLVQVLQSTGVWAVSGTVALSNPSTAVNILGSTGTLAIVTSGGSQFVSLVSSGGILAPVTSSAGLIVTLATGAGSGGAGSTAINLPTVSAAGFAPVTSSYGLQTNKRSTGRTFGTLNTTLGAPVTQSLTTASLWLYSLTYLSTGTGTIGNAIGVYSATSALSTQTPLISLINPSANQFLQQVFYPSGVLFANGLQITCAVTFGTTGTNTAHPIRYNLEYEL